MFREYADITNQTNMGKKEAAIWLGVSHHTLSKWVSQRRIPFVKLGDRVIFRLTDLEKFMDSNLVPARKSTNL